MEWMRHYQVFLFDFDGLLVNTEELHFRAYKKMCADRGFSLKWDFATYAKYAMHTAEGIRDALYLEFPELRNVGPWETLYQAKKMAYLTLLHQEGMGLMPGVKEMLEEISKRGVKSCVVTHSPLEQISLIRKQHKPLNLIEHWMTREDYQQPKPSPECYLKAIATHANPEKRVIGFEDTPRGLKALLGTSADAVLVSSFLKEEEIKKIETDVNRPFFHVDSFTTLLEEPSPKGQWDSSTVKDRGLLPGSPNSVLKDRDCGLASVQRSSL